ncbi:MAG: hypothetical protein K1X48_02020 [Burkholderiaceae bacterium]|nr:hypothetical protein [Burkholderiaceae bacterium]
MAYEGEILEQCGVIDIDFSETTVIAVSGDKPNVFGHLLIYAGKSRGGYYFHVAGGVHSYPHYMTEAGYRRYLRETKKKELRRLPVMLTNPQDALLYLENLLANKWLWLVVPNNCVAFVEEIIKAGGGTWASYSNLPTVATSDTISLRIQRLFSYLDAEIYKLYGVQRY